MTKINKEGWEIKKLGEVATIVSGATPKTNIPEYWGEGHFWITPAEIKEGDIEISKTERTITDEAVAHTNVNLLPEGTVLLSSRAPIGKVAIVAVPMYCNQGFKNCVCKESLHNKFLFYFLRCKNELLQSLGRGATFKEISKSIVEGIKIPLPPLPIQQRIVEELDEISAIISAKKQQLSKLDELAQSIFYNMFGDPVSNEKGWEVKKLGEVCEIVSGSTPKTNVPEYWNGEHYWITPAEIKETDRIIYATERTITDEALKHTNLQLLPVGTVLLSSRAPIGKVAICGVEMYCNQGFKNLICGENINNEYLAALLRIRKDYLQSLGRGATFKEISKTIVADVKVQLPPLPLQETFAARVSAIEDEKAAIAASIEKMQTLLNERMQEYFG